MADESEIDRSENETVYESSHDPAKSDEAPGPARELETASGQIGYQVVKLIGEGGMGKVYVGRDDELKREVAIKTVRHGDAILRARFLEETQIHGQLEHPNVVPIHALGVMANGDPFCVMRYVRGRALNRIIRGLKQKDPGLTQRFSLTRLVQVLMQVAQAIDFAHSKGVVHRDLKPGNIMLGEHGEVQLLDWGLAKVLSPGDNKQVVTDTGSPLTRVGEVVGTPAYMAPEQAVSGMVDERSDVYSLGVLLYEVLTLDRPFRSDSNVELIASVLRDEPRSPREVAPERSIPVELEQVCLRAIAKRPDDRYQSAGEFQEKLQSWLEAEADKAKRYERAGTFAAKGRGKLDEHVRIREEIDRLEAQADELRESFKAWQPIDEKSSLYRAEDRIREARGRIARTASDVMMAGAAALGQDDSHPEARRLLADFFWDRFLEAEKDNDTQSVEYFSQLVSAFDDGGYTRELKGEGSLALESDPPGAEVWLSELVEQNLRMVPVNERFVGSTPLAATPLSMGSYLAVIKKEGFPDTSYPVVISRNHAWEGQVKLHSAAEIGEGFVHVPGGPFIQGGDPAIQGWCLPRTRSEAAAFFIATHPVTMGEYLAFLNHLVKSDPDQALVHAPKRDVGAGSFFDRGGDGLFRLPDVDPMGNPMHPRRPVVGISWHDAQAYCAWRSSRDGREYRLPTETEWEKASRGVDGRGFPWGNRFDANLCNSGESHPGRPKPLPVDDYPTDVSVYGVFGMAGNARDWTSTLVKQGQGEATMESSVIRGGAAELAGNTDFSSMSRCAFRYLIPTFYLNPAISMRLACSP